MKLPTVWHEIFVGVYSSLVQFFLCSEFKLENIYSGVNFSGKNVCGKVFLRIAGKIAKIRTSKNFLPRYIFSSFFELDRDPRN